jgi:hypothetical protein
MPPFIVRKNRLLPICLTALFQMVLPTQAAPIVTADDPIKIIQQIYGAYPKSETPENWHKADKKWRTTDLKGVPSFEDLPLSKEMRKLVEKDAKTTPKGEMGCLDFDPISDSQDPDIAKYKVIKALEESEGTQTLNVHIVGRWRKEFVVTYKMKNEGGNWYVDDIVDKGEGVMVSLKKMYQDCLKK